MNAIALGLACTLFADLVVAAILLYLERGGSRPWRQDWLWASGALVVLHTGAGLGVLGMESWGSLLVAMMGLMGSGALLLRGALTFLGRVLPRWYLPLLGALCVVALLGFGMGWNSQMIQTPAMVLWVLTLCFSGGVLLRHASGSGRWLAGLSLIGLALHQLDFPLVSAEPALLAWGLGLNGALLLGVGLGMVLLDVDRLRRDAVLRQRRLDELVDHAVVGIFRSSPDQGFTMVNETLVQLLGYDTAEEVLALDIDAQVAGSVSDRERLHAQLVTAGQVSGFETTWLRKDGTAIRVELDERVVRDEGGAISYFEGFVRDVTHARLLEDELARSRRMEALGRLAGGVAHEFNNLLAVVRGNASLLAEETLTGDGKLLLSEAQEAARRASELTMQLLSLGDTPANGAQRADLTDVLQDVLALLRASPEVGLLIEGHLPEQPCPVPVERANLAQLVMNLALNARDAMPHGGRLTLALAVVPAPAELEADAAVRLEVIDTGEGMSDEVRARIFEPFFTTRDVGKGTGLGLASVFRLVQGAGGTVRVESAVGVGTTFQVFLPLLDMAEHTERRQLHQAVTAAQGVVLVAEDEDGLRRLVQRLLSRAGHEVHAFSDPHQALAFGRAQAVDMILTDVAMPGLTGPELVAALAAEGVRPPVVYMSGFPDRVRGGRDLDGPLLTKPFSRDELLALMEQARCRS